MVVSPVLEMILAKKRANPYSDDKSIQELRNEHRSSGLSLPLPEGANWNNVDANGVPCEWVSCNKTNSDGFGKTSFKNCNGTISLP